MSDCCCAPEAAAASQVVACSQTKGLPVDELTVKALLTELALRRFEPGAYRFCPEVPCAVVYFSEAGFAFTKDAMRVPIWQKDHEICALISRWETTR